MKHVLFFFLYLISNTIHAQVNQSYVKGHVLSEKKPLSALLIKIRNTDSQTFTNPNGEFSLSIKPGKYDLDIFQNSIQLKSVNFELKENTYINLIIVLDKDNRATIKNVVHLIKEVHIIAAKKNSYTVKEGSSTLRLQEPLINTAQNIQTITKDMLNDQQALTMFDAVERNVSGSSKTLHQSDGASIYMRGFSSSGFRNGIKSLGYFGPLSEDMSFVEKIEFVKGPASFMMGNTPPGGFYNILTKKPTGIDKKTISLTYGSFGNYRAAIDLDGKLSKDDKLLYRLNIMNQYAGSYIDYQFNNAHVIAPSLKYNPNENTSITLEYMYHHKDINNFANYVYSDKGFKDAPISTSYSDPKKNPVKMNEHSAYIFFKHKFDENWNFAATLSYLKYGLRGEQLSLSYNKTDFTTGNTSRFFSLLDNDNVSKSGQLLVSGKFNTGKVVHKLIAGLDMGALQYDADWSVVNGSTDYNIYHPKPLETKDFSQIDRSLSLRQRSKGNSQDYNYSALFFSDQLGFLDNKLRFGLGLRYTNSQRRDELKKFENNVFTPRVSTSFSYLDNASIYAVFDHTFEENFSKLKNGGFAKPSTGRNLEIGFKNVWLNGRLNTTIAAYSIKKNNITAPGPEPGYVIQIGEAISRGIEFDLQGEILPNLSAVVNYAYTDANVTKNNIPELIGRPLPGSVRHIVNSWFTYRFTDMTWLSGIGLSVGHQWKGKRASWIDKTGFILPDDYFSLDAGVSYKNKSYTIALLVNNITNNYNYDGFNKDTNSWGYNHYGWVTFPPRNFRLNMTYNF